VVERSVKSENTMFGGAEIQYTPNPIWPNRLITMMWFCSRPAPATRQQVTLSARHAGHVSLRTGPLRLMLLSWISRTPVLPCYEMKVLAGKTNASPDEAESIMPLDNWCRFALSGRPNLQGGHTIAEQTAPACVSRRSTQYRAVG